ncbi:MAG: SOS response-associated peptidase [Pseudomonadota bacterium]
MCARYSITTASEALRRLFGFEEQPNVEPRYNVAPTQQVPAVRRGADGKRHYGSLRWGLIPFWAKDMKIGPRLINARAETVTEKPSFRTALKQRRCLIAADGFYEWSGAKGAKQPHRFTLADGGPFGFAGLWERWRDPADGTEIESCTIITCAANEVVAQIHPRMPVILPPEAFETWLDTGRPAAEATALLGPYPADRMITYPVSKALNRPVNDEPSLIEPIELSLF